MITLRRLILRWLLRHYERAVDRKFDRTASKRIDCVRWLLDSERSGYG